MYEKKLLIINSKKDVSINKKNIFYINIGDGNIDISKSKKIIFKEHRKVYYEKYKKKLIDELNKKVFKDQNKIPFFIELEIFNLRNDKNANIDLIINILIIKKIIKEQKFKKIFLLTDNALTQEIFQTNFSNIELLNNNVKIINNKFTFLKVTKFYLKAFLIIILFKFHKTNKQIRSSINEGCISLKPIFFKKNKEIFFNNNKMIKFNFLLTDESHLNFSLLDIIKMMKQKNENLIHVESHINFKELIVSLIKSYYYLTKSIDFNFKIDGINLSKFYSDYVKLSLINRLKLNIYNEGFVKALKKFKIKKFNLYLFEYSFGFFLTNLIKKRIKDIIIVGHQHGIFSNKLLWFDLLNKNVSRLNYMPDKVISFNEQSLKDYQKKIKHKNIKYKLINKISSKISIEYSESKKTKYKNKILVLPGTHDANCIYQNIKNKIINTNNKDVFYLKFHPKKKILAPNLKNLKIISSIKNKKFASVLISPTSTLVYDFLNLKKRFMVYNIDNKLNLISSNLSNKVKFYYFK